MMKSFSFCKMHGLGNDFVIVNGIRQCINPFLKEGFISTLADRHRGIGFDQLLLIESSQTADLRCRIFNADGNEAEQCGNGLRCVARFVHEEKIIPHSFFTIETKGGVVHVEIKDYDNIRITINTPSIQCDSLSLMIESTSLVLTTLSIGNPHAITAVESLKTIPVPSWGAEIAKHPAFPQGINVGFMQIINRHYIHLRTYERGVGETLACGSNACAAVMAGITKGWLDSETDVEFACGNLHVEWQGNGYPVTLTGPAARVFSGVV